MPGVVDPRITQLYRDCHDLALYIAKARREIAAIRPEEMKIERLPRAGRELEAIVQATEAATHGIMTAAEEIMAADRSSPDLGRVIEDACMRIFEACSFQDITGQRITKVVNTLTYIEDRLTTLQAAWGPDLKDAMGEDETPEDPDQILLNGPALAGEGVSQADVDALLAGDTPAGKPQVQAARPASSPPAPATVGVKQTQADIDALFD